jgi:hypothetical protein
VLGKRLHSHHRHVLGEGFHTTADEIYVLPDSDSFFRKGNHCILVAEECLHGVDDGLIEAAEAPPALDVVDLEVHAAEVGLEAVTRLLHLEVEVANGVPCVGGGD